MAELNRIVFNEVDKFKARFYKLRHEGTRFVAVIFNHATFKDNFAASRRGTDQDVLNLERVLPLVGYATLTCQDLKWQEIRLTDAFVSIL